MQLLELHSEVILDLLVQLSFLLLVQEINLQIRFQNHEGVEQCVWVLLQDLLHFISYYLGLRTIDVSR
jgi:hypothetical protein